MTERSEAWKQKRVDRIINFLYRENALTETRKPVNSGDEGVTILLEQKKEYLARHAKYLNGEARVTQVPVPHGSTLNWEPDVACTNEEEIEFNKSVIKSAAYMKFGPDKPLEGEVHQVMVKLLLGDIDDEISEAGYISTTRHDVGFLFKRVAMHNNSLTDRLTRTLVNKHYDKLDAWLHTKLTGTQKEA